MWVRQATLYWKTKRYSVVPGAIRNCQYSPVGLGLQACTSLKGWVGRHVVALLPLGTPQPLLGQAWASQQGSAGDRQHCLVLNSGQISSICCFICFGYSGNPPFVILVKSCQIAFIIVTSTGLKHEYFLLFQISPCIIVCIVYPFLCSSKVKLRQTLASHTRSKFTQEYFCRQGTPKYLLCF